MAAARNIDDGVVIRLPCHPGDLCDECRKEVKLEALRWLRELNETYAVDLVKAVSRARRSTQQVIDISDHW